MVGRDEARAEEQEAVREDARLAEQIAGVESRRAVLQDLLARREGTSSGAQELMCEVEGSRLLAEVLTVRPGFERALAAALGPIVQAVVFPAGVGVAVALHGPGPREVVWGGGGTGAAPQGAAQAQGEPPAGTCDLWDVVSGPDAVVRTLKALVPPTAVVLEETSSARVDAVAGADALSDGWRVVTRAGEVFAPGLHAARRTEAGTEALLRAKNELAAVDSEETALTARREEVRQASCGAAVAAREAEALHRRLEEQLHEVERRVLATKNEADLQARRMQEARTQVGELNERGERETESAAHMGTELTQAEAAIVAREGELDQARASLKQVQGHLESLRRDVAHLEEKKGQAALLEVRLKERCRALESERQRTASQRAGAAADVARMARRLELTTGYAPALTALLDVVERLAEAARRIAQDLELRVDEARTRSEAAAKVIRDWGGAEAELQRELDELTAEHTRLQVEKVRLDDRKMLLEEELADLRRKHMAPRAIVAEDVAGETKEALEAAQARAEQRRERIGPVNPLAERECAEMEERARFLTEQRRDLEASIAQLQDVITELDEHINSSFSDIFASIRENFAATIATVFPGAKGTLALTEGKSIRRDIQGGLEESGEETGEPGEGAESVPGVSLSVKFPNKTPRSMSLLSGGEKAMTAIAFLFSLFLARPCPFYILDEVEASLDDVNIRRFLSLVRRYRERTQFIIITHQRQTMEIADTLYGVALESDGTSRLLSRRLGEKKTVQDEREHPHYTEPMAKEA
jgi:chromosome segregation protein